ncbi:MAG: RNA polymerase sigma factor [Candidatus Cloacimonetes bacterium]|nr:RNA polymerase sigma factor [Candidatus Cloacimonadota bacterium]MDD4156602.1 RNA polymerase sigma factor [Candidatus Cloacimonadota bacterium]
MLNWTELVETEGEKLLNYANKFTYNLDDAKDIVQSTFLACYQNINRIEQKYIIPWLYKTAHNKAINFIKKNKRLVSYETLDFISQEHYLDNSYSSDEIRKQKLTIFIQKCFNQLKPKHSLVLELQFYQKKSNKEIAEITGYSLSAIESYLVRAKKECKKIMQDFNIQDVLNDKDKLF